MKSILEQLYYGQLFPAENPIPTSQEYQDARNAFFDNAEALYQRHKDIEKEMDSVIDDYGQVCALESRDMFCYGFRLGVRLLLDALYLP